MTQTFRNDYSIIFYLEFLIIVLKPKVLHITKLASHSSKFVNKNLSEIRE